MAVSMSVSRSGQTANWERGANRERTVSMESRVRRCHREAFAAETPSRNTARWALTVQCRRAQKSASAGRCTYAGSSGAKSYGDASRRSGILGQELGIEDISCVKPYTERLKTAYEHAWEIRDAYGYHQYEDPASGRGFRTFLHGRAWTNAEGPVALFNQSVHWLRRNRVLLAGVSVLARQVAEVRGIAEQRLHATVANVARRADASLSGDLVALLEVPEGKRLSELERMRRPPTRTTGNAMKGALERVDEIAAFRLGKVKVEQIPPNRLSALARSGLGSKAPNLARTPEPKRTVMVTVVVWSLEAAAIDDALDLFALLMQVKLISSAKRATNNDLLSMLPRLEEASRLVTAVWWVLSGELGLVEENGTDLDAAALWRAVESVAPREEVNAAAATLEELVPPADDVAEAAARTLLASRYNTVRPFLTLLGESRALGAAPGGCRVLAA